MLALRIHRVAALALAWLTCAPLLLAPCHAAKIKFTQIDVSGAIDTSLYAINKHNEVTGSYRDTSNVVHGFLRTADGTITSFDPPGSADTEPTSINDKGDLAGSFYPDPGGAPQGFLRRANGTIKTLTRPPFPRPTGLNNHLEITGVFASKGGIHHDFFRHAGGRIATFFIRGSRYTYMGGINSSGTVVGFGLDSQKSGISTGFIRSTDGTIVKFRIGSGYTDPVAINDSGWIAGNLSNSAFLRAPDGQVTTINGIGITGLSNTNWIVGTYENYGVVRKPDGTMLTIHPKSAYQYVQVQGVNARGFFTGYYRDANNAFHGFIGSVKE